MIFSVLSEDKGGEENEKDYYGGLFIDVGRMFWL